MRNSLMLIFSSLLFMGTSFAQKNNTDKEIVSYYYENAEVEFAESVTITKSGYTAINSKVEFELKDGSVEVIALLSLDNPFKRKQLYVEVYNEDDELYNWFNVNIDKNWDFTSFKIPFLDTGEYFVDIYTEDKIYIISSSLEIQ